MPDLRTGAVSAATFLAGLPWRVRGRGKPLSAPDPRLLRVVVIKPCCMGDVLMSTAAVAALRTTLPDAHIAYAVAPWSLPAVLNNPRISSHIDSPVGGGSTIAADYMKLARFVRAGNFGTALVLDRSPLLNAVPYLAGVPVRAGLDSDNRGLALTHPVECPSDAARHEVEWYLDVVRALGFPAPAESAYLEFYPTEAERARAASALAQAEEATDAGSVAIHVGGGANPGMKLLAKRWRPEDWARIADWLAETYEVNVVLLGGPSAEDREAADAVMRAVHRATQPYIVDLVGKLDWGALGAAIGRCRLFLGNDTGAMHLATAVHTPVVAVFGPSDPARYGPWDPSGRSRVVAPGHTRSDAEALRRASAGSEQYHNAVTPEQVWQAVQQVYASASARERAAT